jgi:hypothetical protein
MHLRDDKHECSLCGAALDLPFDALPFVVIKASGGSRPRRTIFYMREEIHACPIGTEKIRHGYDDNSHVGTAGEDRAGARSSNGAGELHR